MYLQAMKGSETTAACRLVDALRSLRGAKQAQVTGHAR
jgi:hypothetical protein